MSKIRSSFFRIKPQGSSKFCSFFIKSSSPKASRSSVRSSSKVQAPRLLEDQVRSSSKPFEASLNPSSKIKPQKPFEDPHILLQDQAPTALEASVHPPSRSSLKSPLKIRSSTFEDQSLKSPSKIRTSTFKIKPQKPLKIRSSTSKIKPQKPFEAPFIVHPFIVHHPSTFKIKASKALEDPLIHLQDQSLKSP